GYQGIAKRPEMAAHSAAFRVAMRPGKRQALPNTADGKLQELIEAAKAHLRAKVEHPFRVIKQQFGFQKTRLRGLAKNRCKVNVLAALSNLSKPGISYSQQPEHGNDVLRSPHSASISNPKRRQGACQCTTRQTQSQSTVRSAVAALCGH
ncbi:transposase, IS5 family protein, partial [Cyanobium sp. Copco_Reservoir_LC18]